MRAPGGVELRRPQGELSRALGIGLELAEQEEVDLWCRRRAGRARGRGVRRIEGLETGDREHRARRPGGRRDGSRTTRFPAGISGSELTSRAIPRHASSGRARDAVPRSVAGTRQRAAVVSLEDDNESRRAPCCSQPVPNTATSGSRASTNTRGSDLLRGRPTRGRALRRAAGRRRRGRQLSRAGRRLAGTRRSARDPASPPRRSARDDVRII